MMKSIKYITILSAVFLFVNVRAQINELHMVPDSGRSGYPISISYTINNTDQFVAFQFDIILPSVLTYIQDSVWLYRTTDHFIITNQVDPQTLRIVAFSPTNQPFTGNDGEIVRVMFDLNGSAGTYNVGLSNVTISNAIGTNILTGYSPSYIKITSPDISGENDLDFGEVSVLDTISHAYQLYNTGIDTLFVTDFYSSETYFWVDTPLPVNIPPYDSATFNLKFHNIIKGQYITTYTIMSNDPDENPFYIDAAATSFAPNYILIENAEAYVRDTVTLKIDVDNYEEFYNFQVDLDFPDSLSYVSNSATLTSRGHDHSLFEALLAPNKIRLFTYSSNNIPFLGDTGTIATMDFVVGNDTGYFPLILSGGLLTDSIDQNIIRGTIDGEIYVQKRPTFQLSVIVSSGWNMLSAPGINPDGMTVGDWWPNLTGTVFSFDGTIYQPASTTKPGLGYWMKNTADETYSYPSIEIVAHDAISATTGWNMIGGYETSVATSGLTTVPAGQITGTIFGFDGTVYQPAATLEPGYGYWVKTLSDCEIVIPEALSKVSGEVVEYFKEDWGRIILTDASGKSYTLYAVKGEVDLDQYEMPPAAPGGMFDIRFSSGRIAEDINSSMQIIDMSGVTYPIFVMVKNIGVTLKDESGKVLNEDLNPGDELTISNPINKLVLRSSEYTVPVEYSLEQNFPNPFNPCTTIMFRLPETVEIRLTIYNTLGEKITEIVNQTLDAGNHSYNWDATNSASGIYIYQLKAGEFIKSKKMMLLR